MMLGEVGLTETTLMVGAVFCTAAVVVLESLPPYPSETETVQVMVSSTEAMVGVSVKTAELPTTLLPILHSYVGVRDSPSESVTVAEQVIVESA